MTLATFLRSLGGGDWLLVVVGLFIAAIIWQSSPTAGGMIVAAIFIAMLAAWGNRGFTI